MKSLLNSAAAIALLMLGAAAVCAGTPALKAGVFDPPRPAPDFSLQGSDGSELRLSRYRGNVVLLAFGYTSCPYVCPTTLATFANTRRKLGAAGGGVQVIYVTVDPGKDNAAHLKQFLGNFDATFMGGTGTEAQLSAVRKSYGVTAQKQIDGESYSYTHSSFTYLIDRKGRIRALMPYGHSADDYVNDLTILLKE